jgi:2-polyprenyl-6-methoxyphenol hydroxylase-like FAD-dependent oxidoreductase
VIIVGAGPTGLTLAVQLLAADIPFRLIDAAETAVHESRALAIQARTLEVLERDGIAARLVERGDTARLIRMHGSRTVDLSLFDSGDPATRYPFLLFLSQAETEQILAEHLTAHGIRVERGTTLVGLSQFPDRADVTMESRDGIETASADYVVGCDGAHSAVRRLAGIEFAGRAFPQTFLIADIEVDGLETGPVHAYVAEAGLLFFFPLGEPTTWRLLAMAPDGVGSPDLADAQRIVDSYVGGGSLHLRDPAWLTDFRVHSRHARRFRDRHVFLAGDAAHIHSPAGAQGMNTGIQDAANLSWKLAQVIRGSAPAKLLDTYEEERLPIALAVLRMTNRLFGMATTSDALVRFARPRIAPAASSAVRRLGWIRAIGFRVISQLSISYRRRPLARTSNSIRLGRLRAGDRLPPLVVVVDGARVDLRDLGSTPRYLLAAIGANPEPFDVSTADVEVVQCEWPPEEPRTGTWILIRPDGYIAGIWRSPAGATAFLENWTGAGRTRWTMPE